MSFNLNLNDKDYYNYAYNYQSLIDEQRKRHRSTYAPHVFQPSNLVKELKEQGERDHLKQIRQEDHIPGREQYARQLRQLKDRFSSRYPNYLDEQRRRRHREAYARPLYRQRSIEREMDRQKEQEHLREIKRDDIKPNKSLKDVIELKDRNSSRYPSYNNHKVMSNRVQAKFF